MSRYRNSLAKGLLLWSILSLSAFCVEHFSKIPPQSTQALVVYGVEGTKAKLDFYEKYRGEWRLVKGGVDVTIGRNGVGKLKEGDGRTPSGVYRLGDVYGYRGIETKMPFFLSTEDTVCVDDTASRYYNRIVDRRYVIEDFRSFEYMKRKDDLYEIVVTVGYNPHNRAPLGSCIFLHISNGDKPTAGCVAMEREALERIVERLDPKKAPVIYLP